MSNTPSKSSKSSAGPSALKKATAGIVTSSTPSSKAVTPSRSLESSVASLAADVESRLSTDGDDPMASSVGSLSAVKPASHEKILEEWKQRNAAQDGKKDISVVVVGHVDAGKSTLMGRILHDTGMLSDREHSTNARASARLGKGSFAYAWALDASEEERER